MSGGKLGKRGAGFRVFRRLVQLAFLALFVLLAIKAAFPPVSSPPANIFLRLDPLAGLVSLVTTRSASVFLGFWPAWILLGLTMLSSRFFCGWICPLGTCFDMVGLLKPRALRYYKPRGREMRHRLEMEKSGTAPRRLRVKYLILALVLGLALVGVNLLYFSSPLVISERTMYYILLPQLPILFLVLLLLAFFYRPRFWCEDLCPMGALMSLFSLAGKGLGARLSPLAVVKDAEACIDCGACYRDCSFGVEEPYTKRESGRLRSADCTACGECVSECPAGGALALESFGVKLYSSSGAREHPARERRAAEENSRAFAHRAENAATPAGGSSGGRFTVSRGEFISSLSLGAVLLAGYGVGLRNLSGPLLRMPGAQDESQFLARCNRCQACSRACPAECIKPMGLEDGFQKLWTPRFDPRTASCIFDQCDQACARVCPVGAIDRVEPEEVRIGLASVDTRRCLGWKGRECLVCKERCRFNAIEAKGLRPVVIEEKCTGCGACEQTCPTEPASIRIFRLGESPSWPSGGGRRRSAWI